MQQNRYENLIFVTLLTLIFAGLTFLTWGTLIDVSVDFGRELYIPTQIINGEILYRDIFNIYGPLAYLINAGLVNLFGADVNVFIAAGTVSAFVSSVSIYFIAEEFMRKPLAFWVCVFVMGSCVFSPNVFNFVTPYSYSMTYGFCAALLSVLAIIKFIRGAGAWSALVACFFAGISLACKIEFAFMPIILAFVFVFFVRPSFQNAMYAFCAFLTAPVIAFGLLFYQGIQLQDLLEGFELIRNVAQAKTLQYFYMHVGTLYSKAAVTAAGNELLSGVILFVSTFSAFFATSKIKSAWVRLPIFVIVGAIAFVACYQFFRSVWMFAYFPMLLCVISILAFRKLLIDRALLVLVLCALFMSAKTFFFLNLGIYGTFSLPLIFVAVIAILNDLGNETFKRFLTFFVVLLSIFFAFLSLSASAQKNSVIETYRGRILTSNYQAKTFNQIANYVLKNTKKSDTILVMPETPLLNFMTDRASDNMLHSLIPLYVETFGEDYVLSRLKKTKPEYIIINSAKSLDYGTQGFCRDYALKICDYVGRNYRLQLIAGENKIMKRSR